MTVKQLELFIKEIDGDFPVPISEKTDIAALSNKLCTAGIVCTREENGKIIAAVCGYANDLVEKTAFISLVGTTQEHRGRGLAERLVLEFIHKSKQAAMERIVLYTHHTNAGAIRLYRRIGFEEIPSDRAGDIRFVYNIRGGAE